VRWPQPSSSCLPDSRFSPTSDGLPLVRGLGLGQLPVQVEHPFDQCDHRGTWHLDITGKRTGLPCPRSDLRELLLSFQDSLEFIEGLLNAITRERDMLKASYVRKLLDSLLYK